jgi:hypothetical protein
MGRVRCVKPKADGVSVVKTKTAKKKVARKKSKVDYQRPYYGFRTIAS